MEHGDEIEHDWNKDADERRASMRIAKEDTEKLKAAINGSDDEKSSKESR